MVAYFAVSCVFVVAASVGIRNPPLWLLCGLIFTGFSLIMISFSFLYWAYGQPGNFNIWLSHLDAVYFTLGTLTTAGTGNIVATSETTRAIQSIQMAVDLGFTLLAVGILVSRLPSSANKPDLNA